MAATDHLSKMVMQRKKLARELRGAIGANGSMIASGLGVRLAEHLADGEALPDLELFVRLFGRSLDGAAGRLQEADDTHHSELLRGKHTRRLLRQAKTALYRPVVDVRREAMGLYGAELAGELFGFRGRTPRSPSILHEGAAHLVQILSRGGQLPPTRSGATVVDPGAWLAKLQAPLEQLEEALDQTAAAERGRESTRIAKQKAMAAFDDAFDLVLRGYLLLLELAGESDVAERERRRFRRPHRFRYQPAARWEVPWAGRRSLWEWLAGHCGRLADLLTAPWRRL